MALPATSFDTYFSQIAGTAPASAPNTFDLSTGAGPATAQATGPAGAQTFGTSGAASPAAAPPAAAPSSAAPSSTPGPNTGAQKNVYDFGSLFAPVTSQVGNVKKTTQEGKSTFDTAAGQSTSYAQKGGNATLDAALKLTGNVAKDQAAFDTGQSLVDANYAGPAGLDQGVQDVIAKAYQPLNQQTASFRSQEGAGDLVRQATSGLSASERDFESQNLLKHKGYQTASRDVAGQAGAAYSDYLKAKKDAEAFATARSAEEADISKQATDYVTGRQQGAEQAVTDRMGLFGESEKKLQGDYDAFTKEGDLEALAKLLSPEDQLKFDTATGKTVKEAKAVKEAIFAKPEYASLKDVPLMELAMSKHGREALEIPREWWAENTKGMSKKEMSNLKELAIKRQLELEEAGFSPGSAGRDGRALTSQQVGKYSAVDPLYHSGAVGGKYETPDARSYVNMEMGNAITRGSVANEDERNTFNRANQLLRQADQIEQEDPYTASVIRNEAQRFFDEQGEMMKLRQDELKASVAAERNAIAKGRKAVRKSKKGISGFVNQLTKIAPDLPGKDAFVKSAQMGGKMATMGSKMAPGSPGGEKFVITPKAKGGLG